MLIPENTSRKLDSLGRVSLPKGLRDRMYLDVNSELEFFTAMIDGRQYICLAKPQSEDDEMAIALDILDKYGYEAVKRDE